MICRFSKSLDFLSPSHFHLDIGIVGQRSKFIVNFAFVSYTSSFPLQTCHSVVEEGVAVLHGNRRAFHNDKQPAFKAVYEAISGYDFEKGDPHRDLILRIKVGRFSKKLTFSSP